MKTYKLTLRAMLIAGALILSWVESQIPAFFTVPGMKLGLTNLIVLVALYKLSAKDAIMINLLRIFIVGITFGNLYSMSYALAGGILSFVTMYLLKRFDIFNTTAVSIAGGIMHNVGQILIAMVIVQSKAVLFYLPFLWLSGIAAGAVIGILCSIVVSKLPESIFKKGA